MSGWEIGPSFFEPHTSPGGVVPGESAESIEKTKEKSQSSHCAPCLGFWLA